MILKLPVGGNGGGKPCPVIEMFRRNNLPCYLKESGNLVLVIAENRALLESLHVPATGDVIVAYVSSNGREEARAACRGAYVRGRIDGNWFKTDELLDKEKKEDDEFARAGVEATRRLARRMEDRWLK
jgi:hypothetical protein